MGQKPDPNYDPESSGHHYYYHREERLALPNAPKRLKRKRTRVFLLIILDGLILFFGWQCILDLRRDADRQRTESEVVLDGYHYKAIFEKSSSGFEAKLLIRRTNDAAFAISTNALARFVVENHFRTNTVSVPADGVELPRPLHLFRAGFPGQDGKGRVRIGFFAAGSPPDVELELDRK